ncbi:peptidylprolyl isomerase [uncultured Deefgea sp.]|uniref:peptidylprolyl isomerase n=1 Tax=uncultured Deefgea sp. TaxID=1304914 RepID=UPI00259298C3|nr:peptidylprolyl isomerase [uncultured Deefgea sp.]
MGISVNGVDITDASIQLEHQAQPEKTLDEVVKEVILRAVLLQEAQKLGIEGQDDDEVIGNLLERQVKVPQADAASCLQWYEQHPTTFVQGELMTASHILFQVSETVPLELLRDKAESILADILQNPALFEQCARQYSNCPSGQVGGSLGQFSRGEMVPEFDKVVFALQAGEISPRLLETRFGLHILRCEHKLLGKRLDFAMVQNKIAQYLHEAATRQGMNHYLQQKVRAAKIEGFDLIGADSVLMQ